MADPAAFLYALAQALSVMALYPAGHPSRERAIDPAYQHADALAGGERPRRSRSSKTRSSTAAIACAI